VQRLRWLLLIVLAVAADAQWRRIGEPTPQSSVASEALAAHNAVRARTQVPPLAWSAHLAARAQDWANTLLARRQFSHRPNAPYGENLFSISGGLASPAEVVRAWADEARNYDYADNSCRGVCGHYTQIVWADTTEVGCAVARGGGREVWVCNYNPPGNWVGRRPW